MTTNTAPDEMALRLPEFQPGVAIVLSDGQAWHFRMPVVGDYYPAMDKAGKVQFRAGSDLGIAYDAMLDRYADSEDGVTERLALTEVAFALLKRNYAVGPDALRFLLRTRLDGAPDADANRQMWAAIAAVALGRTPADAEPATP